MEPYIVREELATENKAYRLKIANNIYASPCNCKTFKGIHFHHSWHGPGNLKGEQKLFTVDETKEYPNA